MDDRYEIKFKAENEEKTIVVRLTTLHNDIRFRVLDGPCERSFRYKDQNELMQHIKEIECDFRARAERLKTQREQAGKFLEDIGFCRSRDQQDTK